MKDGRKVYERAVVLVWPHDLYGSKERLRQTQMALLGIAVMSLEEQFEYEDYEDVDFLYDIVEYALEHWEENE